jgi:L-ascorbate metabolism protein UlaG (beta-lactamase superfamily)
MLRFCKLACASFTTLLVGCSGEEQDGARPPLPAASIAARERFFGAQNVDPGGHVRADRVIVSWFGVSSLAVSLRGHVVLLDTYINNGGCPPPEGKEPYVATTYAELGTLLPEAVFIGHDHFDHQCQTAGILRDSGAALVGLPAHCEKVRADGFVELECVEALDADSAFGAVADIQPLGADVAVTAVRNLHSGTDAAPPCNSGGCEAVLYRFAVGEFSFVWNDSNGPLRGHAPELLASLRALPPSDVELGAIIGTGFIAQGMRDPVDYAEALRVKELYPLHHDLFAGGTSSGFRAGYEAAFAGGVTAHWLQDPGDYLRPIVFDVQDERWRD